MPDAHAKTNNLGTGLLYFYVHFVTEVICFFVLGRYVGTGPEIWIIFLLYDMLAFVPQAMIGINKGYIKKKSTLFSDLAFGV